MFAGRWKSWTCKAGLTGVQAEADFGGLAARLREGEGRAADTDRAAREALHRCAQTEAQLHSAEVWHRCPTLTRPNTTFVSATVQTLCSGDCRDMNCMLCSMALML